MNTADLPDFGVIRGYCAALRRNGDKEQPSKLMDRLYTELESRDLVGAMLHYLPVYSWWRDQNGSAEATQALVALELDIEASRHVDA